MTDKKTAPVGLDLLREPFPANLVSKLPKPTKSQTDSLKAAMAKKDFSLGIRCKECGGWHHKDVIHLDYVGHAALTSRLLDCDSDWNWEPVAFDPSGKPLIEDYSMWIRLTVCGVTRLGFGSAEKPNYKSEGDVIKEIIGDALRNAAMRFGAALDLWHKGDLHPDDADGNAAAKSPPAARKENPPADSEDDIQKTLADIWALESMGELRAMWSNLNSNFHAIAADNRVVQAKDTMKAKFDAESAVNGDEIPY